MTKTTPRPQRYRGFVLTPTGLEKLQAQIHKLETQTRLRQSPRTIAERVQLHHPNGIHPMTVRKVLRCQEGVDKSSIHRIFQALDVKLEEGDCVHANLCQVKGFPEDSASLDKLHLHSDWGDAIDVSNFYGRADELTQLSRMIIAERCRLVALLGMGGVGKTALAVKLAQQLIGHRELEMGKTGLKGPKTKDRRQKTEDRRQKLRPSLAPRRPPSCTSEFEYMIWKSLRYAPPLQEVLVSILQFFSKSEGSEVELPTRAEDLIALLLERFQRHRCLLVLDQVETVLNGGDLAGYYREGYESYGEWLRLAAAVPHQSCLVLTSREKPREVGIWRGKQVYSLQLGGLRFADSQRLFRERGRFMGSKQEWEMLIEHYAGNPLALKVVADRVWEYFNGNLFDCLEELRRGLLVFNDLRHLIGQQFNRLSLLEQAILGQLMIYQQWTSLSQLRKDLSSPARQRDLLEVLDSLNRRSLLEKRGTQFRLQPFVIEYISEYLVQPQKHSNPQGVRRPNVIFPHQFN